MELKRINLCEAEKSLITCFEINRPVFLWGPPGIGKSDLIKKISEDISAMLIDLRLSQFDPTDLRGIPYFNSQDCSMEWAPPADLPNREDARKHERIILFLDELNSATPAVQAAAYQLILDRKIGNYSLPDNVVLVAAGNRESDKGITFNMPSPLANRFIHLELKADFDTWLTWGIESNIHPDVVSYLTYSKSDLYDFDPKSTSRAFATPRSWEFVSQILFSDSDEETRRNLISGTIGDGLTIKFMAYRKISSKLPNPIDILNGKVKKIDTKEISAHHSLIIGLCYELKSASENKIDSSLFHNLIDNFFKFIMQNFSVEMVIMGAKIALGKFNLPIENSKLKTLDEFHDKYGHYIHGASS